MHIFNFAVASLATTVKGSYQVYLARNTVGAHFCYLYQLECRPLKWRVTLALFKVDVHGYLGRIMNITCRFSRFLWREKSL